MSQKGRLRSLEATPLQRKSTENPMVRGTNLAHLLPQNDAGRHAVAPASIRFRGCRVASGGVGFKLLIRWSTVRFRRAPCRSRGFVPTAGRARGTRTEDGALQRAQKIQHVLPLLARQAIEPVDDPACLAAGTPVGFDCLDQVCRSPVMQKKDTLPDAP